VDQVFFAALILMHQSVGSVCKRQNAADSTIDHEKKYIKCGKTGVIYSKQHLYYACYFEFEKK